MRQETYNSSTLGAIPLSFTGRRLLQNLREAISTMLEKSVLEAAVKGQGSIRIDWEEVSVARGKLAQYMSHLERGLIPAHSIGEPEPIPTNEISTLVLPPIPPGYELSIVGHIVSISPIQKAGE